MEYNENQNFNEYNNIEGESIILKEKRNRDNSFWYWIIAVLILGLFAWYVYTSGWFNSYLEIETPIEQKSENNINIPFGDSDDIKASIDNVTIRTSEGFPVEKTLSVKGMLADGCTYLNEPQVIRDGNTFYVNLTTRREGDVCTEAQVPYERNIGLDLVGLPAGTYKIVINGKQTSFELEQDNSIDFSLGEK